MMSLPSRPWQWVLFVALIAQIVLSLILVTGDYSQAPAAVGRDIYIVAGVTLVCSLIGSGCLPTDTEFKLSRNCLLIMVIVTALAMFFAIMAGALTVWVIAPSLAMACGLLLLYRELALTRANQPQD